MTNPESEVANLMEAVEDGEVVARERIESMGSSPEAEMKATSARIEALETAIETDPAAKEAAREDVAVALKTKLGESKKDGVSQEIIGIESAMLVAKEGGEVNVRDIINKLLEERYKMTLDEFLNAFKPTKLEYLNPTLALSQESAVWVAMKAFDIEPTDMSLKEKAEYRWKVGADALKIFSLLAKFIPEVSFASVPAEIAGNALGRMGDAMEKINSNPDASIYDQAKDLTEAILPRDDRGNVDRAAALNIISLAGGKVSENAGDSEYIKAAGDLLKANPERFASALEQLDNVVSKK